MSEPVPIHPVAPRLKDGPKKPHVGTIDDYRALHAQSIGPGSDEYWSKAGRCVVKKNRWPLNYGCIFKRSLVRRYTGTGLSRLSGLVALKTVILSGFPKEP
jgi:hypothetical protein